jgi:hypothetical protein
MFTGEEKMLRYINCRNASLPTLKTIAMVFPAPKSRSVWYMHSFVRRLTLCCRFVEAEYNLEIGAAQVTQLSKAITSGELKGIFVLPKGPCASQLVLCLSTDHLSI